MLSSWRSWCRLCASQDAIFKLESTIELNQIVQKHFMISVTQYENSPTIICEECYNFINKLEKFRDRCLQVDKMFSELTVSNLNLVESDLNDVRFRYGLESELISKVSLDDSNNGLGLNAETTKMDQCVDTNDLESIGDIFNVKIEEEVAVEQKKKRGRRRKIEKVEPSNSIETAVSDLEIILQDNELEDIVEAVDAAQLNESQEFKEDEDFDYANMIEEPIETDEDEDEVPLKVRKPKKKKSSIAKEANKSDNEEALLESVEYSCEPCNKVYNRRQMYEHHIQSKHPDSLALPFVCSKCPKGFATEKKVKIHETIHLPENIKMVHPCPYCDKKFSKQVNVQAHIKAIHIGERPFICEECGKSFGTKGALKEHQITHSEERPFQCSHCPKKFKNLPRLKTHEDIHNDTMYVCPHCGLQLNTKRTLKMHMVVHSDQKKYKCHYCGNEYKRSKALKNHLILHTGLRPYLCPFCDKTFANGSNCRSHKKKSHPQELAALEASGEQTRATNIPKLEHLQPKPHQIQSMQQQTTNAMTNNLQTTINNLPVSDPLQQSIQNIVKEENLHENTIISIQHHQQQQQLQNELQTIVQIPHQLHQQQHIVTTQQLQIPLSELHNVVSMPTLQLITTNNL